MAYNPSKWGPATSNKGDYEFMMQPKYRYEEPISLLEHAVTSPSQNLTDPVVVVQQKKVRGKIMTFEKVIKGAEQTGMTYTMLFPSSLWTPAMHRANLGAGGTITTDFFALYLCPSNDDYRHAYIWPEGYMDPPSEVEDFLINTNDAGTPLTHQTTLRVAERLTQFALLFNEQTVITDQALTAVSFVLPDCFDVTTEVWTDIVVGEDGDAAAPKSYVSDDRFATNTGSTTGAPTGSMIEDIYSDGDTVLMAYSDGVGVGSGVIGGTAISADGGVTFTLDADITEPVYGVTKFGGSYVAVGGTGAGAGLIWTSSDGVNWDAVTSTILSGATDALTDIDVDGDVFYAVGEGGTLVRGQYSGDSIVVNDLSANLPGTPGTLNKVLVLTEDNFIVAGAAAYMAETEDGGETFVQIPFPGSASIVALDGNRYRLLAGAGTKVYESSILNRNSWTAVYTATGNITDIDMAEDDFNYFVIVTDGGEVVFAKPPYPNA